VIRVAIADDHPELRLAVRLLLYLSKEIKVVCENRNGQEAVDCVRQLHPDILVMDIQMPVLNGFETARQIVKLTVQTCVILISTYGERFFVSQAAEAGAQGFALKDDVPRLLLAAIEAIQHGEFFFKD
jgi:Response regulator containing a CheY-like receiver domain and an HTH DNA-binding domain